MVTDITELGVTMTSLEIAELTGKNHSDVLRDIRNMLEKLKIDESKFASIYLDKYSREQKCFRLDKRRVQILIMGYEPVLCNKVLDYIDELEGAKKPLSLQEMTLLVIEGQRKEIEEMKEKILLDAPKVHFAETISGSTDSILIREFSKIIFDKGINMGEKKIYQYLRDNGYLSKKNEPYIKCMQQGLFEVKESHISTIFGDRITKTTLLTGKGQIYFFDKFKQ